MLYLICSEGGEGGTMRERKFYKESGKSSVHLIDQPTNVTRKPFRRLHPLFLWFCASSISRIRWCLRACHRARKGCGCMQIKYLKSTTEWVLLMSYAWPFSASYLLSFFSFSTWSYCPHFPAIVGPQGKDSIPAVQQYMDVYIYILVNFQSRF